MGQKVKVFRICWLAVLLAVTLLVRYALVLFSVPATS